MGFRQRVYVVCGFADRFGDAARYVALTVIAAQVYGDALLVSALTALRFFPWLVVDPLSGELADRVGNGQLALWANAVKSVTLLLLAAALYFQAPAGWLMAAAVLCGLASVLVDTAYNSWLPQVAGEQDLPKVNSVTSSWQTIAGLVAPVCAGFLALQWRQVGLSLLLLTSVLVVQWAVVLLARESHRLSPTPAVSDGLDVGQVARMSWWQLWVVGWQRTGRVLGDARLWPVACAVQLMNVAGGVQLVVLPVFLLERGTMTAEVFGYVLATQGVGMLVGARLGQVFFGRLRWCSPRGGLLLACGVQFCGFVLCGLWVLQSVAGAALILAVIGLSSGVWNVVSMTWVMQLTERSRVGSTMAGYKTAAMLAAPMGALAGAVAGRSSDDSHRSPRRQSCHHSLNHTVTR